MGEGKGSLHDVAGMLLKSTASFCTGKVGKCRVTIKVDRLSPFLSRPQSWWRWAILGISLAAVVISAMCVESVMPLARRMSIIKGSIEPFPQGYCQLSSIFTFCVNVKKNRTGRPQVIPFTISRSSSSSVLSLTIERHSKFLDRSAISTITGTAFFVLTGPM